MLLRMCLFLNMQPQTNQCFSQCKPNEHENLTVHCFPLHCPCSHYRPKQVAWRHSEQIHGRKQGTGNMSRKNWNTDQFDHLLTGGTPWQYPYGYSNPLFPHPSVLECESIVNAPPGKLYPAMRCIDCYFAVRTTSACTRHGSQPGITFANDKFTLPWTSRDKRCMPYLY